MEKPEKYDIYKLQHGAVVSNTWREEGFNEACDDWEAYHNWRMSKLPGVGEIKEIINTDLIHPDTFADLDSPLVDKKDLMETLSKIIARKIAKRIGGERDDN